MSAEEVEPAKDCGTCGSILSALRSLLGSTEFLEAPVSLVVSASSDVKVGGTGAGTESGLLPGAFAISSALAFAFCFFFDPRFVNE